MTLPVQENKSLKIKDISILFFLWAGLIVIVSIAFVFYDTINKYNQSTQISEQQKLYSITRELNYSFSKEVIMSINQLSKTEEENILNDEEISAFNEVLEQNNKMLNSFNDQMSSALLDTPQIAAYSDLKDSLLAIRKNTRKIQDSQYIHEDTLLDGYELFFKKLDFLRIKIFKPNSSQQFVIEQALNVRKSAQLLFDLTLLEGSLITRIVNSQAAVNEDLLPRLALYRDLANQVREQLKFFIKEVNKGGKHYSSEFVPKITKAEASMTMYLSDLDEARRSIYVTSLTNTALDISQEVWNKQLLETLDAIEKVQRLLALPSDVALEQDRRELISRLIVIFLIGVIVICILFLIFLFFNKNVLNPVQSITNRMSRLAAGDLNLDLPEVKRQDEIKSMIVALGVFKETALMVERAKEQAEIANRSKSDFLANMSHELRTPLNSIIGMTKLLLKKPLEKDDKEMIRITNTSALLLLNIVNDILDLSKIESSALELEEIPVNLIDVFKQVMDILMPLAKEKNLSLSLGHDDTYSPEVIGDPIRIGQIVTNLVGNAIKYTQKGSVKVKFSIEKDLEGSDVVLKCSVKDSGIGIAPDKIEHIFTKFSQEDVSTTRKFGGTGLGLTITKQLVEMMDGEINLKSQVGKGSVFSFQIPLKVSEGNSVNKKIEDDRHQENEATHTYIEVEQVRVLVAEDHLLNQEFIKRLLESLGFKYIYIVDNGRIAMEEYIKSNYDLILMDCHMPEMNGYEATQKIRELEKERTPIIALTADAMKDTRQNCLDAGMDDYLAKPIDEGLLVSVLSNWIVFSKRKEESLQEEEPFQEEKEKQSSNDPVDLDVMHGYAKMPEEKERFIKLFFSESKKSLKILEAECLASNNDKWSEALHSLKGGASMIGAYRLNKICKDIEGKVGTDTVNKQEFYDLIEREYKSINTFLDRALK